MKKITKNDVSFYAVDISGSSYVHFVLTKQDESVKSHSIGDGFWLGNTKELGNEFMVSEDNINELMDRDEEENLFQYLDDDCAEMVEEIVNNHYTI